MPSQSGVRAGRAYVEYNMKDNLTRKMARVQKSLRKFGMAMVKIGGLITAAMTAAVISFVKVGDQLHKMSKRTGMAVDALSRLSYAAKISGTSLETVEKGIKGMQRTLLDASLGLSTAKDVMKLLNLSLDDLRKMTPEKQFRAFAQALSQIEDPSERAAIALKAFGRAGQEMLPLFEEGALGLSKLALEAEKLGGVWSEEEAEKAAKLADAWTDLTTAAGGLGREIANKLVPPITKMIKGLIILEQRLQGISFEDIIVPGESLLPQKNRPSRVSKRPLATGGKRIPFTKWGDEEKGTTGKGTGAFYLGLEDAVMSGVEDGMKAAQDALTTTKSGLMGFGALKLDALLNAQRAAPAAMSSAGTFNAAALASISHGGIATPAEEKTAKNTERMTQLLNSILRELREGGLAFS